MLPDILIKKLRKGQIIAGQLQSTTPEKTSWIGVYPLHPDRPSTHEVLKRNGLMVLPGMHTQIFCLRLFEVADSIREPWFGENDLENVRDFVIVGEDELFRKLADLDIPIEKLDIPSKVEYPL